MLLRKDVCWFEIGLFGEETRPRGRTKPMISRWISKWLSEYTLCFGRAYKDHLIIEGTSLCVCVDECLLSLRNSTTRRGAADGVEQDKVLKVFTYQAEDSRSLACQT